MPPVVRLRATTPAVAALAALLAAGTLGSGCARSTRLAGGGSSATIAPATTAPATSRTPGTTAATPDPDPRPRHGPATRQERRQISAAFTASVREFYEAGRPGQPGYAALVASFVPGSPALEQTVAWLAGLEQAGVVAPTSYRIGLVRVRSVHGPVAVVSGCTFDTGSVYAASGLPAPPALGGGAGLTASVAVLHRVHGRWLVWSDQTSAPRSAKEEGPCHGF